jgi:hypothetical protein
MAAELFNSLGGYSVGIPAVTVIDSTGNLVMNVNYPQGNATVNTLYANNYLYANGLPFKTNAAGSSGQVQFNNNGSFGAIPSVTWNGSILSLGIISNLSIQGGLNGYYLQTDGTGNLTWSSGTGSGGTGVPGGANTQLQFNDSGVFGGSANLTYNKLTDTVKLPNVISNNSIINLIGADVKIGDTTNLSILGGANGYLLTTDGQGNLSWTLNGVGSPGGSNTNIQFNKDGAFGGSSNVTYNETTDTVNIEGNLIANSFVLGSGINQFATTRTYTITSTSSSPDQLLYSVGVSEISAMDLTIISTDDTNIRRQFNKIAVVAYGNSATYNEYSTLFVGGQTGDFRIICDTSNELTGPVVNLVVSPTSSAYTVYRMTITTYVP